MHLVCTQNGNKSAVIYANVTLLQLFRNYYFPFSCIRLCHVSWQFFYAAAAGICLNVVSCCCCSCKCYCSCSCCQSCCNSGWCPFAVGAFTFPSLCLLTHRQTFSDTHIHRERDTGTHTQRRRRTINGHCIWLASFRFELLCSLAFASCILCVKQSNWNARVSNINSVHSRRITLCYTLHVNRREELFNVRDVG